MEKLEKTKIISEVVNYKNARGKQIVGFFDHSNPVAEKPFIVIPPSYGETKRHSITLAHYFVKNGFNIIRYDNTDHIGESEGEMVNFTLMKAKEDLISTLDFIEKQFNINQFGIVASSLAARIALRAATEDKRIKFILSLVGIVDLQYTLKAVYNEDMIGAYLRGERWGPTDVLGFEVNFENFSKTAVENRYHDLKSTKEDMKKLNIPVVFIAAEKDVWDKLEDVEKVFKTGHSVNHELYTIPNVMHELYENPTAAKDALKQVVVSCTKYLSNKKITQDEVIVPSIRDIAHQNHIEKERIKTYELTKEGERNFWSKYLTKYILVDKSHDYQHYLALMSELLGEPKEDEIILDVGCGPGHFGTWLARKLIGPKLLSSPAVYVGLDFAQDTLKEAILRHAQISRMGYLYVHIDIENSLSNFSDNLFDKICCSLFLSYLKNPQSVLKELFRILKPGGKIVVTSMKPYADFSQIYRSYIVKTKSEEEITEARDVLSAAGKIKQKEGEGHYQFFSQEELVTLLNNVGARNIKVYRSFGNQANVVVAEK